MITMEHTDWAATSARIRDQRAARRCECTGGCGTPHSGGRCDVRHGTSPTTGALTVLTVAHLDRDPGNTDDDNLAALCYPCHFDYNRRAAAPRRNVAAASLQGGDTR